jgi:hypothetical protein
MIRLLEARRLTLGQTAVIGAAPNERTESRTGQRNGHRQRVLTTTAGDLELRIPSCGPGRSSRRCWSVDDGSIRPCSPGHAGQSGRRLHQEGG